MLSKIKGWFSPKQKETTTVPVVDVDKTTYTTAMNAPVANTVPVSFTGVKPVEDEPVFTHAKVETVEQVEVTPEKPKRKPATKKTPAKKATKTKKQ